MARGLTVSILRAMTREEWRLHAALFGGRRFAALPAFIGSAGAGTVWLLLWTGTTPANVAVGLHLLVFAFGLYTGLAGLVGRDAIRDLLGDVTLLVFAARPLPVSERRLLAAFLIKDAGFYASLFIGPIAVAYAPAAMAAGTLARLPLLWGTLVATFVLGMAITLTAIAAQTRGVPGPVGLLTIAGFVGAAWALDLDLLGVLPYGLYRDPTSFAPLIGFVATVALGAVGLFAFDLAHESPSRTAEARFVSLHRQLRFDPDGLLTKTLLDVSRSAGGVGKVVFSGGILFIVTAALIELAASITGRTPSTGLSFGAMLGLSAFTTYNWVTQFDDIDPYLAYPVSVADVFDAKGRAFAILGIPTAMAYYLLAIVIWGERLSVTIAGAALIVGLSGYLFGLTVSLAGFSPNEFLFDTLRFVGFTVGAALALVPVLVVAFVMSPVPPMGLVGLAVVGLMLGAVGYGLFRRAIPRWEARFRRG